MANGKKSFVFYCNWRNTFAELPKDKGYDLLMHILAYVNDEDPQTDDVLIKAVFANMKDQLKADLLRWERKQEQRIAAGKASAESRKRKSTTVNDRSNSSTVIVSGNGIVNDNGIINNTKKEKGKRKSGVRFSPPSPQQVDEYFLESGLDFEESKRESEKFCNYYESKGWLVGKVKMKSWKGAAANWLKRYQEYKKEKSSAKKEKSELTQQLEQRYGIN